MTWTLIFHLNKGQDEPYFLSEWGTLVSRIRNDGKTPIHVSKTGIEFEWLKEEGRWWIEDCSVELEPKEEKPLPDVEFRIPIDIKPKSYTYRKGVVEEELVEGGWKGGREISWGAKTSHILIKNHPRRDFKVFISHSNHSEDKKLIDMTYGLLTGCGINAYVAEKRAEPGVRLWSKLEKEIRTSDLILVFWTKHGAVSGDVREEIGIAVGAGKYEQIIPIVEVGVDLVGSLKGKEWAALDRENPKRAIIEAIEKILEEAKKKPPIPAAAPI